MAWFRKRKGLMTKDLGYGYIPIKWQGWIVLIIWLILVFGAAFYFNLLGKAASLQNGLKFIGVFVVVTVIFVLIAMKKTEK